MLLPELNTPVGFAGKDGFYWWIGQVETGKDIKNSNRYKVRIVGQHLKSCTAIPYDDLPWATIMLPVTHPSSLGNSNYTPAKLQKGDWVIGFFLDGASGQHPVIMGQMQRVTSSTKNDKLETKQNADACLGFTTYVPPTNPTLAMPASTAGAGATGAGAASASSRQQGTNAPSAAAQASAGVNNPGNPMGRHACHPIADAGCKDTATAKTKMEEAMTEIFGSISQNGGTIGTKMLSEASGKLVDYAAAGRGYVTRVFGIANAYLRNAKFQMITLIKQGVEQVVKWLMGVPTPPKGENPKSGPVTKKKNVGFLGRLIKDMNEKLAKINCEFADFEEKLLNFLTNLITDLLLEAVSAATCVIEAMISKVLSEIESFLVGIIDAVLGPLQSILGIIASPLNILGAALQYIFQLIGLSCTGPGNKCSSKTQHCTGSANKKKPGEDDFKNLDKLIADIESKGVSPLQTSCEESYALPCPSQTTADVSGGTPGPGSADGEPALDPPEDPYSTIIPDIEDEDFVEDEDDDPTDANIFPPVNISINSSTTIFISGSENISANINSVEFNSVSSNATIKISGSSSVVFIPIASTTVADLDFFLTSDKNKVTATENISFTLSVISGSVPDGTEYNYILYGNIQNKDFANNTTIGKIKMYGGVGVVTTTLSETLSITNDTLVTFAVLGPGAKVDFTIYTNVQAASPTIPKVFVPPVLGNPIVDNNGKIIDIPIIDPGDAYLSPPFVTIYGEGIGGFASVELDDFGKLKKVIVDRPGTGYTPSITSDDNCYMDGFIVIRPGYGYTSEPSIYIDGDPTLAKAIINSSGNVTSIKIVDKIKRFNVFPNIEIVGGGGMGAKAIPSFNCLEPDLYKKYVSSVAPSGSAEVIDCPSGDCDDCTV